MGSPMPTHLREAMKTGALLCHYCHQTANTWDHIVPRSLAGPHHEVNLVPSCAGCNSAKAGSLPVCRCCRCRTALGWWQANLPDESRARLAEKLTAQVAWLASVLAALHEPVAL